MEKRTIVFATNNAHKLGELRGIAGEEWNIVSLAEIGCHDDIPETAETLEGNALIKARWVKERYGYDCFADDTGLMVDALDGAPGVYSARYAGPGHDSAANIRKLLAELDGVADRKARFRTVIALILGKDEYLFEGIVDGAIAVAPAGCGGFGYDSVFVPENSDETFAQMSAESKNNISHRGRAVKKLIQFLKKVN